MIDFNNVSLEKSFGTPNQIPISTLPEIIFCGRSNVGKSSLLNKICNRKSLARTSSTPGKTITINFFKAGDVRLVDLPGYGYAKRSKTELERFGRLMDGYFSTARNVPLALQLVDIRRRQSALDDEMMALLSDLRIPFAVILTKADKLNKTEFAARLAEVKNELPANLITAIPFSSLKNIGISEVKSLINQHV